MFAKSKYYTPEKIKSWQEGTLAFEASIKELEETKKFRTEVLLQSSSDHIYRHQQRLEIIESNLNNFKKQQTRLQKKIKNGKCFLRCLKKHPIELTQSLVASLALGGGDLSRGFRSLPALELAPRSAAIFRWADDANLPLQNPRRRPQWE